MAYLGICDKFGENKVTLTSIGAPQILYWGLTSTFQQVSGMNIPLLSEGLGSSVLLLSSLIGFFAATISHDIDEGRLSSEGVGNTRGSKIIQKGQLQAYFTIMKYGVAASALTIFATSWMFNEKPENGQADLTVSVDQS